MTKINEYITNINFLSWKWCLLKKVLAEIHQLPLSLLFFFLDTLLVELLASREIKKKKKCTPSSHESYKRSSYTILTRNSAVLPIDSLFLLDRKLYYAVFSFFFLCNLKRNGTSSNNAPKQKGECNTVRGEFHGLGHSRV